MEVDRLLCCISTCINPIQGKTHYCLKHYGILRHLRRGAVKSLAEKLHWYFQRKDRKCVVRDCCHKYSAKGYCSQHYSEQQYRQKVTSKGVRLRQYIKKGQEGTLGQCSFCSKDAIKKYKTHFLCLNHHTHKYIMKIYRIYNREHVNKLERNNRKIRHKNNVNSKLAQQLRSRLASALRTFNAKKPEKASAVKDLGCSLESLKLYLEKQFKPGMTWNNWSVKGWHIDHIIPISRFDLAKPEEFKKACHYTNLQPLWSWENISKSDRI